LGKTRTLDALKKELRRVIAFPQQYPPVSDAIIARNGEIWIGNTRQLPGKTVWTVYEPNQGRRLARVEIPSRFRIRAISRDLAVAVVKDEFDVEQLAFLRVRH
jgi:hypothetical protein